LRLFAKESFRNMPDPKFLIQTLRGRGYRITPQREMIVQTLVQSERHMSAEEIYQQVQSFTRATNIATVYRTLELLVAEGMACQNDLGSGRVVYSSRQHGTHIHLVCRQCGEVIDADNQLMEPLRERIKERYSFDASLDHISLSGLCESCQSLD
jgi:Fur family ferric uptake transcriptional regulator